nr:restriction endonuclease subunit S [uncultured Flavobacterium sp.]
MLKVITINNVVQYSKKRINSEKVTLENFISTDNILQNKLGITQASNLPPNGQAMPFYEQEDILIANIRPYLKKIWFANKSGGCSSDVLVLEAKSGYFPKYVYYNLFKDDFFDHVMKGSKGTKMPRGDKNQILDFLIPDFEFSIQQKIAKVLSSLDSKIEINNKINAELEAMAKTLYDYWFVQFDFPDANGKPYKTSGGKMVWNAELKREIPEGWEIGELKEIANITTGKLDSNAEVQNGKYPFYTCASEPTKTNSFAFDDTVILIAGNNAAGNFHINRYKGKFNAYQRTYITTAKNIIDLEYLYQVLKTETKLLKSQGKGSQTKFLTIGMLTGIKVFKGNSITMNSFNNLVNPMFEQQVIVRNQNQELASLRDWLLPMLMNGQVSVGEVEKELGMVAEESARYGK